MFDANNFGYKKTIQGAAGYLRCQKWAAIKRAAVVREGSSNIEFAPDPARLAVNQRAVERDAGTGGNAG